jgi:hypothetical protein
MSEKISFEQFANSFFGPEDERKEACIHCKKVYYAIHHKDGVCNSCQKKKLPGRSTIIRRQKIVSMVNHTITLSIIVIGVLYLFFSK